MAGSARGTRYENLPDRTGAAAPVDQGQRARDARNITDEPQVLHQPAPYNLLSLRDLYTQIPDSPEHLKRFGSDVFLYRGGMRANPLANQTQATPLDVPIGPDYVVGPGDTLTIDMWG